MMGVWSFKVDKRAARKGRNPMTGDEIELREQKTGKVRRITPNKAMVWTVTELVKSQVIRMMRRYSSAREVPWQSRR